MLGTEGICKYFYKIAAIKINYNLLRDYFNMTAPQESFRSESLSCGSDYVLTLCIEEGSDGAADQSERRVLQLLRQSH